MRTVALDVSVRKLTLCEVRDDVVIARATGRSLADLRAYLGADTPPARVAFEACREGWYLHDELERWGHTPLMLDTTRVRAIGIGQHQRKTDRIDAEVLARALARNTLPVAHVLSPARRALRQELAIRSGLVEARTRYVVTVRGLLQAQGVLLPSCETATFVRRTRATRLTAAQRDAIEPLLTVIETTQTQLEHVEVRLEALARTEPVIGLLATTPGVGLIVAATFVSALDEAGRFRDGHSVAAYLGLVPCENSSGDRRRLGAITKQGNPWVRVALVQAAHTLLRTASPDDPLRCWARELAARRGKMVAIVALARRLAGVLWALWRDGTVYDPAHLAARSAEGLLDEAADKARQAAHLAAIARAERKLYVRTTPKVRRRTATREVGPRR